jgi:GNAT superfamily N-acetyltransferase
MTFRLADERDLDALATTIALAFRDDPVWGPALTAADGGTDHLVPFWRAYLVEPVRAGTVRVVDDTAAVAVWVGPGGIEISEEGEAELRALVESVLAPERVAALDALWERFEESHPDEDPLAYLSLLATHPDHRGRGIAQQLLADDLRTWDARGIPQYLESTNPANDHRYARAGFAPHGAFRSVLDDAPVTTMRRPVSGG